MSDIISPHHNELLADLKPETQRRLFPKLEWVMLPFDTVVNEVGQRSGYVYFPIDSIVSLLNSTKDGASAEVALVGNDGMIGIAYFMGAESTLCNAIVRSGGSAYRVPAREFCAHFGNSPDVRMTMLRYTLKLIDQMAQTAICNRHHRIEQQLCRWILLSLDRVNTNTLMVTQELISNMLGVRREGVTEAAGKLQRLGAIKYKRGKITVLDRPMIESLCCECYDVVEQEKTRVDGYKRNHLASLWQQPPSQRHLNGHTHQPAADTR